MIKISVIIFCLFFMVGCQPATKYTIHQEYVEEQKLDRDKGLIKNSKGSFSFEWEN